jgi:hypothetical protein
MVFVYQLLSRQGGVVNGFRARRLLAVIVGQRWQVTELGSMATPEVNKPCYEDSSSVIKGVLQYFRRVFVVLIMCQRGKQEVSMVSVQYQYVVSVVSVCCEFGVSTMSVWCQYSVSILSVW